MQGWVKLYRKVMNDLVWTNSDKLKLWMLCLLKASHSPNTFLFNGREISLNSGQFVTGRYAIASEFNNGVPHGQQISDQKAWRMLKQFEKSEMLNIKSTTKYSVISISKWEEYQQNEQQTDIKPTSNEQQTDTNKNVKNDKKDNSASPAEKDPIPYSEIISYLNEKTGKSFKNAAGHQKYIRARWNEGQRLDDFKRVIDLKSADWLHDDKMAKYLQPSTLFGTKFDSYLNSQPTQKPKQKQPEISEYEKAKKLNHYIWNRYNIDGKTPEEIQADLTDRDMQIELDYINLTIKKLKSRIDKGE